MTAMPGPNSVQLLETADEAAGGPLFYVVSHFAPVPDVGQTGRHGLEQATPSRTGEVFGET